MIERAHESVVGAGAGTMASDYREVHGRPGSFIESIWHRDACGDRYVVLPDGQTDLLFRRVAGVWKGHVVGPLSSAMWTPPAHGAVVGVRLALGAARAIVGAPLEEIAGRMLELRDLGIDLDSVLDAPALDAACESREGLASLALAISTRTKTRAPVDWRVREAVEQLEQGIAVHDVAQSVGVTDRHLLRLFRHEVGLSPKRVAALIRLRRSLDARLESGASWASVAARMGYADESHFSRECRHLTGMTPTLVARAMSDSFNVAHVLAPRIAPDEPFASWPDPA